MSTFFRNVPSLNEILEAPPLKQLIETANRQSVVKSAKKFLSGLEAEVRSATASVPIPNVRDLASQIARWISEGQPPRLTPVINATGDLLSPSLTPPPLAKAAIAAMQVFSAGYNRQQDAQGQKKAETAAVESLLCELTGAEAALVLQSSASALLLALSDARQRGEIVISRGDLVQSPRGLRISDLTSAAGAALREVGAANKTTLQDFEAAISNSTAAVLSVRWSASGSQIPLAELVESARRKGAPLIADLGSPSLIDLKAFGVTTPTIAEAIKTNADLVCFATEEFLGAPQAGVLLGKRQTIERLRLLPLYPSLSPAPVILAGLLATLESYKEPAKLTQEIPVLSLLSTSLANLEFRAQRIAAQLLVNPVLQSAEVVADTAPFSGEMSTSHVIPTFCVQILPKNSSAETMKAQLEMGHPSVLLRSRKEYLCIDLRSVLPDQDARLIEAFDALAGAPSPATPSDGGVPSGL